MTTFRQSPILNDYPVFVIRWCGRTIGVGLLMLTPLIVQAQDQALLVPDSINQTRLDGNAFQETRGVINVNMAAGDFNLQFNGTAISLTPTVRGRGVATLQSIQNIRTNGGSAPGLSTIAIRDNAFANVAGLIAINQSSGVANAQANGVAISVGPNHQAADVDLSQSVAATHVPVVGNGNRGTRSIRVEDTAFRNARGVVQVNQSAGVGNATANSFSLRLQTGWSRP